MQLPEVHEDSTRARARAWTFYDLRRTFATVARDTGDKEANRCSMGHATEGSDCSIAFLSSLYRTIDCEPLRVRPVVAPMPSGAKSEKSKSSPKKPAPKRSSKGGGK